MAHPPDHFGRKPRGSEEAYEITRHDDRHLKGRKAFEIAPEAQKRALQAIADHQHEDAEEKRPRTAQDLKHHNSCLYSALLGGIGPQTHHQSDI